jgi:hypothetical protein
MVGAFVSQAGETTVWSVKSLHCLGCPNLALGMYEPKPGVLPLAAVAGCVTRATAGCPHNRSTFTTVLTKLRREQGYGISTHEKDVISSSE